MNDALRTFGAALAEIDAELDWELLGRHACEGDGSDFYDAALRESIVDIGVQFAEDIGDALRNRRGRSLYLGAEVAEVPIILAEHLVMGRRVEWLNLDGPTTNELTRAIRRVSERLAVELPAPSVRRLADVEPASCDHLWMVSVLTDPECFPALHDVLYERTGGPLATGRGSLIDDRRRADALVADLLERAGENCILSTTDEELTVVEPQVARRGWTLEMARRGRITAIVGDSVRIGTLRTGRTAARGV